MVPKSLDRDRPHHCDTRPLVANSPSFLMLLFHGIAALTMSIGVQLKAMWVDGTGCVITETNNTILAAIFIYSMCFDLIVLGLNTYKLFGINSTTTVSEMMGRSRLTKMIFADGLIYFVIA